MCSNGTDTNISWRGAWVKGRRGIWNKLSSIERGKGRLVWFHAASLGEFEQGRPVMERLREIEPHTKILLTFFSPSGYEIRKNYPGADYIYYLPLDTPANAKRFIDTFQPDAAVFIKYEFWYNFLRELHDRNIPTYLISAIFRPSNRNLKTLCRVIELCYKNIFLKNWVSSILLVTTYMYAFRTDRKGGIMKGTLYIPSYSIELNPLHSLKGKIKSFSSSFYNERNNSLISVSSSTSISNLRSNSIDYVFTDPPFGSNIMYSELNSIWESWIKVITNNKEEAIINNVQISSDNL